MCCRPLAFVVVVVLAVGCAATPPDVRQASTDVTTTLGALRDAETVFHDAFVREIDATQAEIVRAIVARAVLDRAHAFADSSTDVELGTIADALRDERAAQHQLIDAILRRRVSPSDEPEVIVDRAIRAVAASMRASSRELEARAVSADEPERSMLQAAAADLSHRAAGLGATIDATGLRSDYEVLAELQITRRIVRTGAADLESTTRFLQLIHGEVDAWLVTDVRPDGDAIAALLERHAPVLGVADSVEVAP